jgi:hypothetical protein
MFHHFEAYLPLFASIAALGVGAALYGALARSRALRSALHLALSVVLLVVVVGEVLPHALEHAGIAALLAAAAGALAPFVAERGLLGRGQLRGTAAVFGVLALAAHALTDGVALGAADAATAPAVEHGHHFGDHGLAIAVLAHRVPDGAALWWLLAPLGTVARFFGLFAASATTAAGFFVGAALLNVLDVAGVAALQAFVAGALLHALAHGASAPEKAHAHG